MKWSVILSKKLLLYAIPKDIKIYLYGSNVQMFGAIGNNNLNKHVFIKHNCIVVCSHNLKFQLSKLTNNIKGIKHSHIRWMIMRGIGYKISKRLDKLEIELGFSHTILFRLEEPTVNLMVNCNKLKIWGCSLNKVTLVAKKLKMLRKTNVYNGTGIVYRDQRFELKVGKR
ncbi:50S ribosomal protein L6 [Candidatus Hodgkinia cicadicola]|uniref:50S ribosomal protein L6 n=1 Tax=Candidatus Hodgkinia cicadicola TaxID=573658 RepID=A0ABX4MJQ1_9HYPH|nr:50S ribosomal protein L6 [Candidatus Hodgkinia cicadicola]